jgi:hypothetical protein
VKNLSLSIFSFEGGAQFTLEPSNCEDRIRLIIHDLADKSFRGGDIILSFPMEQSDDLAKAVVSFNSIMRFAQVTE